MLALISPSKTQDFSPASDTIDAELCTRTRQMRQTYALIELLKTKTQAEIAELMKISEKLAALNFARFQTFPRDFSLDSARANTRPALLAFQGDVYHGIDARAFSAADLAFAQQHLRILSGLYGVIRPLDLIAPYRLEMGTKLANVRGKNLYEFWGDKLSDILNQDEHETIINLASNEYFKGVSQTALNAKIIHIAFKENKNGVPKIIGIYAKRARGLMVNYMIKNRITTPEPLKAFCTDGYQFRADLSDEKRWVFTRG